MLFELLGSLLFWEIVTLLTVVGLASLVLVALVRGARVRTPAVGRADEILKERYARGELSREESERMRREIGTL